MMRETAEESRPNLDGGLDQHRFVAYLVARVPALMRFRS
jgi:hypothetical protein